MMNFLAAGHETSAGAITWIVFVLATKPEAQDKLRSEVSAFLKKHPTPNYNEIESFQYLNIFVMESLRVFAPSKYRKMDLITPEYPACTPACLLTSTDN